MRVQLLYFDECPNWQLADTRLREALEALGRPIEVAGRCDGVPQGRARRERTDEVMERILAMTGQEWAGEYATRSSGPAT